jgi:hypothetical protein
MESIRKFACFDWIDPIVKSSQNTQFFLSTAGAGRGNVIFYKNSTVDFISRGGLDYTAVGGRLTTCGWVGLALPKNENAITTPLASAFKNCTCRGGNGF